MYLREVPCILHTTTGYKPGACVPLPGRKRLVREARRLWRFTMSHLLANRNAHVESN